jgi:hypothetical protein
MQYNGSPEGWPAKGGEWWLPSGRRFHSLLRIVVSTRKAGTKQSCPMEPWGEWPRLGAWAGGREGGGMEEERRRWRAERALVKRQRRQKSGPQGKARQKSSEKYWPSD